VLYGLKTEIPCIMRIGLNVKERRSCLEPRSGIASVRQLELPLVNHGDESTTGTGRDDAPVEQNSLLERVLEADNLRRALRQVRRNRGAPGIDRMTVEELPEYLKEHWLRQRRTPC